MNKSTYEKKNILQSKRYYSWKYSFFSDIKHNAFYMELPDFNDGA